MNNIDYNLMMENQLATLCKNGNVPRLLLHVCCAPCATYCLTRLISRCDVTLYYSNDNITDADEWNKRLGEIRKLVDIINNGSYEVNPVVPVKLVVKNHDATTYYNKVTGLENEKEGGARCEKCFELRLTDTFNYAKANNFPLVATTLTVSPYKNSNVINHVGESLETDGVTWLHTSFKKQNGYNESIRLCNKYNIYRQHYCGCSFSQSAVTDE